MDTNDAEHVLRVLAAAFPTFTLSEDTVELYVTALSTTVASADVGIQAAQEIAMSQLYFPKIAELLAACHAVGQRKNSRVAGELPVGEPLPPSANAERLAALREQMPHILKKA